MTHQNLKTLNATHALPPLATMVFALAVTVLKWEQRRQTRSALRHLSAHHLRDIGVDRQDAQSEGAKPFWRP
jgi:uncharacterized protein YjiS (DUF1127 family)